MKRLCFVIILACAFCFSKVYADEGMWMPYFLHDRNIAELSELGCKLSAEDIFSFNQSSLKDAVVLFGRGCTGELISEQGLLLTNHHCGLSQVQAHSSPENDYLKNGFWATSREEELPNPGLTVSFLSEVKDITSSIVKEVTDANLTEKERESKIEEIKKNILETLQKEDPKRVFEIRSFFHGNQYLLFSYTVYKDIRLVGCPPWGIGKFGADTDNWTWPRHKGDFCIFRVYTSPDGSPAEYSSENVPLHSKQYFPISIKGVQEGDFAMILGYPGSTSRYSPSQAVDMIINQTGPSIIACRSKKLDIIRKHSDASQEVFIKYASKQATVSNYWKYNIGQIRQLENNNVIEKRQQLEEQFEYWVRQNSEGEKYNTVLEDFKKAYETLSYYEKAKVYHREAGIRGGEAVTFASNPLFMELQKNLEQSKDKAKLNEIKEKLKKEATAYFKDYDYTIDCEVTTALLELFYREVPADQQPPFLQTQGKANKGNFQKYVDKMFKKSIFTSQQRFDKWLENPTYLNNDPIYQLSNRFIYSYVFILDKISEAELMRDRANRLFMEGLMEMMPDHVFYPDANLTMRLTYGSVQGYSPADGITYDYKTTLEGTVEKEIPGDWEFDIPGYLKTLYIKKDYEPYADEQGELIVNFIANTDITGGNSGSAILDAEGNIIGLAFDGNWEAMSGDIYYEKDLQRTIAMDARYLLFIIDKFAGSDYILKELKIVK